MFVCIRAKKVAERLRLCVANYANCAVSELTNLTNTQRVKNVAYQKVSHLFYKFVVWNLTTCVTMPFLLQFACGAVVFVGVDPPLCYALEMRCNQSLLTCGAQASCQAHSR